MYVKLSDLQKIIDFKTTNADILRIQPIKSNYKVDSGSRKIVYIHKYFEKLSWGLSHDHLRLCNVTQSGYLELLYFQKHFEKASWGLLFDHLRLCNVTESCYLELHKSDYDLINDLYSIPTI